MKRLPLIHPFLFGIYPILFLFALNANEIFPEDIYIPLAVAILGISVLYFISWIVIKDMKNTAVATSVFLFLFSIYGYIFNMVEHAHIGKLAIGKHKYILPLILMLFLFLLYRLRKSKPNLDKVNKILFFMSAFLIVSSMFNYALFKWNHRNKFNLNDLLGEEIKTDHAVKQEDKHDIYYIILDAYANDETLRSVYNYDNSDLLNFLQQNKFRVAKKSRSNHAITYLSLASSLNMMYDTLLTKKMGELSSDRMLPYEMIKHNKTMKFLLANGYRYIHINSGWGPTSRSAYADQSIKINTELITMLFRTTMLSVFSKPLVGSLYKTRILNSFEQLEKHIPKIEGPKFVFAHLLIPHLPYVFKANGEDAPFHMVEDHSAKWEYKDDYLNQLIYTNSKVKAMVKGILANSKKDPIIIIQSDHGPGHTFQNYDNSGGWENPSEINIREKMRILNVYHLPGNDNSILYDSITPVNTFRLIFNRYFKTKLTLMNDQSFYSSSDKPYKFINVTQVAKFD